MTNSRKYTAFGRKSTSMAQNRRLLSYFGVGKLQWSLMIVTNIKTMLTARGIIWQFLWNFIPAFFLLSSVKMWLSSDAYKNKFDKIICFGILFLCSDLSRTLSKTIVRLLLIYKTLENNDERRNLSYIGHTSLSYTRTLICMYTNGKKKLCIAKK